MAINSSEIERQAGRLDVQIVNMKSYASSAIEGINDITRIVRNDVDTTLGDNLINYSESLKYLVYKIEEKFSGLSTKMHNYASQSIDNAETVQTEVLTISDSLTDVETSIPNVDIFN